MKYQNKAKELKNTFRALPSAVDSMAVEADKEVDVFKELILHVWVHSGYENCGYRQMTTEQKAFYNSIIEEKNLDD